MSHLKWNHILSAFCIAFSMSLLLSGCSGVGDWTYDDLPGGYELWRINSRSISLCIRRDPDVSVARNIVGSYIIQVASDERYIAVQQVKPSDREDEEKSREDWTISYYLLDTKTTDLLGPLDEAAFQDECSQIDTEDFPLWLDTSKLKGKS